MTIPVTQFNSLINIRRTRLLPVEGHVSVLGGQNVEATDVIAEADNYAKHLLIDIKRSINLSPSDNAKKYIVRKEREWIQQGDVIAEKSGVFKQIVRSPVKGRIITINNGKILIEVHTPPLKIHAGIPGIVRETYPDRGVVIEANGALLQGVWGNNLIDTGLLSIPHKDPDTEFDPKTLDISLRGSVIMGSFCSDHETINQISHMQPHGLILGSVPSRLIPLLNTLNFPVILLEGIGRIPVNQIAYDILIRNEKETICLNAVRRKINSDERPEIIIPSTQNAEQPIIPVDFMEGQVVRLHGSPYEGSIGKIEKILVGKVKIPLGTYAKAANIILDSYEKVVFPLSNLEVVSN